MSFPKEICCRLLQSLSTGAMSGRHCGEACYGIIARSREMRKPMRLGLRVLGVLMMGMGTVWILQGINVLPGSFMTGQIIWAYRGAGTAGVGLVLLLFALRPGSSR